MNKFLKILKTITLQGKTILYLVMYKYLVNIK